MSGRGILNATFIDCSINIAVNSHIVGPQLGGSYLANIIYKNCSIDGHGTQRPMVNYPMKYGEMREQLLIGTISVLI